jgi:hypothetical protein
VGSGVSVGVGDFDKATVGETKGVSVVKTGGKTFLVGSAVAAQPTANRRVKSSGWNLMRRIITLKMPQLLTIGYFML